MALSAIFVLGIRKHAELKKLYISQELRELIGWLLSCESVQANFLLRVFPQESDVLLRTEF